MRYHDENEMCVSVLKNINLGDAQNLSSHTGLSSWKLNRCLELLQKNSLIKNEENTQVYKITEKGVQYLNSYNKIIELLCRKPEKREEIIA
jgi:predicted transcriptional regulator